MFRSPLAAAMLQKAVQEHEDPNGWDIRSAGTWTTNDSPPPPITLQIGKQLGLRGIEMHRTYQVEEGLLQSFDLILVMESNHREAIISEFPAVTHKVFLLSEAATGKLYDIPDPTRPGIDAEEVANELSTLIQAGYLNILATAQRLQKTK